MEDSPLNLAHREDRRAQQHLKFHRFEEAVQCHQQAAKYIEDAMLITTTPRALESLSLQKEFHLRQLHIVQLKKTHFALVKKALENKRKIMAHMREKILFGEHKGQEPKSLQYAIYQTMQEADSLFIELLNGTGTDDVDNPVNQETAGQDSAPISSPIGSKHPKGDRVVIEELHTLNHQLRDLIKALIIQLDESERENKVLRGRIVELENELVRSAQSNCVNGTSVGLQNELERNIQGQGVNGTQGGLQVITDSTGGNFSPFVLSPVGQLSPDVVEARELPPLAPLEMPTFDYNL
ncbi:Nuclear receptor-binding factor 2 [Frankliniella fusca]|uniref:Nuclear receptor-binding factor 2 n=1 Tax=Frankliniella fusca TaxID=407009 RepID=A0AAE1LKJ1_9NEOP|nr:Nuclear receptor-binding factor 2 [Frankliniella fusca]